MVLNIESCSEGRKDRRVEEVVEEEEEKGRRSSSQNWMGSRASGGRGERERELHRRIGDAKSSHQIGLTRLYYPHGS